MGFWSTLGTIAGIGLAPFTGGASLALGPAIGGGVDALTGSGSNPVGQAMAGAAPTTSALEAGLANGRLNQSLVNQRQDLLGLQRYQAGLQGANTDLAQRAFGLQAPGQRAANAVRGDILANAQDVNITPGSSRVAALMPQISGGLRPSMFSPSTRALGATMSQQANDQQQKGDTFAPIGAPPSLTPLPQSNVGDTILNTASTIGNLYPTFDQLLQKYRKNPNPVSGSNLPPDIYGTGPDGTYDPNEQWGMG